MRKLFHLVVFLPRLLFRFLWHLFWGLFKTALLLAVIAFSLLYYANNSQSDLARSISTLANNISTYFSTRDSQSLSNDFAQLSVDDFQAYNGSRWSTNTATVYIATTDDTLISAYQQAIENWNSTGAFTFTFVSDESSADIIATDYSDANSQAAGLAESVTNAVTNQFTHVDVMLNTYYLTEGDYGYDMDRIVNTAEHELGHAIGLNHDDTKTSVMQSSGSYYGIQQADIAAVNKLYAH